MVYWSATSEPSKPPATSSHQQNTSKKTPPPVQRLTFPVAYTTTSSSISLKKDVSSLAPKACDRTSTISKSSSTPCAS